MGGEGSMLHMISSLKRNKQLLGKKKSYFNDGKFISNIIEKTEYNLPKLSPEELELVIKRIQEKAKKQKRIRTLVWLLIFVLIGISISYIFGFLMY